MEVIDFVPTGVSCAIFVLFIMYMQMSEKRSDKNRAEHVQKWDTIIAQQNERAAAHNENTRALIASFNNHMDTVITLHKSEKEWLFKLHERNTSALEALTVKINQIGGIQ